MADPARILHIRSTGFNCLEINDAFHRELNVTTHMLAKEGVDGETPFFRKLISYRFSGFRSRYVNRTNTEEEMAAARDRSEIHARPVAHVT